MFEVQISPIDAINIELEKIKTCIVALHMTISELFRRFVPNDKEDYTKLTDKIFADFLTEVRGVDIYGEHIGEVILTKYNRNLAFPSRWRYNV